MSVPGGPWVAYGLHRIGGWGAQYLSDAAAERWAQVVGRLFYRLDGKGRANIRDNMHHVMGSEARAERIEEVVRGVYGNMLRNYLDLFRIPRLTPAEFQRRVEVIGFEDGMAALAEGRGLIGGSAHLGNPDTVGQALAVKGYPILAVMEHVHPESLFNYLRNLRETFGNRYIAVDGPLRPLLRQLKQGGVIALALDRDPTGSGTVVNFFGTPARLPDGAVRLALRTEAPLVLGFCRRIDEPLWHYQVHLHRIHLPVDDGDRDAVRRGVEYVASYLADAILETPEQWVMSVPIWQQRADPKPPIRAKP